MSLPAWGKFDQLTGQTHHLAHHCADVAACFSGLLRQECFRDRAEMALGRPLSTDEITCLTALAFLHDLGKVAPAFQAIAWPSHHGPTAGHLKCGHYWQSVADETSLDGLVGQLAAWPDMAEWMTVIYAHHGRPSVTPTDDKVSAAFTDRNGYSWRDADALLGQSLRRWFPAILNACPPPATPRFAHFIAGLLNLADWIGSDRRAFPFVPDYDANYWTRAEQQAQARLQELSFAQKPALQDLPDWQLISDHPDPRAAQLAVGKIPADEQLVILEAETGAGKTEAALWRFVSLYRAGKVEALYFAVPTRTAARQLHRRINAALSRMFVDPPEAVLAIPGQIQAGEAKAQRLPEFQFLWDDDLYNGARWAAEHSARYLTARIAIGTIDQAALGGLQAKFAHLRGTAVSRALLVIDEVHASDAYMTEVQNNLLQSHLAIGGYAILMSATLGAVARSRWLGRALGTLSADRSVPYPAVWTKVGPTAIDADTGGKTVSIHALADWSPDATAALAVTYAQQGARVLVIRNTVDRAQQTFEACAAKAPDLMFQVHGVATVHHSRFAAQDRLLLDRAVEDQIGKDSPLGGRIVIGTQTLEQSLDLCADILITDLCPIDVLLQRIGRLHRHRRARPAGFERAQTVVLTPPSLAELTQRPENGLGARASGPTLSGVYIDVPGLQATLDQISACHEWQIPVMNRHLVEAATHPDALDTVAEAHNWQSYRQKISGKALSEVKFAELGLLDRDAPLKPFPDDTHLKTRLGESGLVIDLPEPIESPFGHDIRQFTLPAHWAHRVGSGDDFEVIVTSRTSFQVGLLSVFYGSCGMKS